MNDGHFKLGLFVTVAVALLVGFLLTLGVMDRFRPHLMAETYFDESIQGLQRGADVQYRGVKIGSVGEIGFASAVYEGASTVEAGREVGGLVRVEMAFDVKTLSRTGKNITREFIDRAVDQGFRTQLSMTGIGGPVFIELNFVDTRFAPEPDVPWEPRYIFIPSVKSRVGSILDALASILQEVDRGALIDNLVTLSKKLDSILGDFEQSELYKASIDTLAELRGASVEARTLLADPRIDTILADAGATFGEARTFLEAEDGKLESLIADMTTMSQSLDRAAGSLDTLATNVNKSDLIGDLERLANDLGPAGRDLSDLATRLDRLVKGNEAQIADTIRSLRNAVDGLQALLEELKANPARILSAPPPKGTPGGNR